MKLTIVYGYYAPNDDMSKVKDIRKTLIGQTFQNSSDVIKALRPSETVNVQSVMGYKQIGKNKDGQGWIQKRWVFEY